MPLGMRFSPFVERRGDFIPLRTAGNLNGKPIVAVIDGRAGEGGSL
jgi:hypothetical protein